MLYIYIESDVETHSIRWNYSIETGKTVEIFENRVKTLDRYLAWSTIADLCLSIVAAYFFCLYLLDDQIEI